MFLVAGQIASLAIETRWNRSIRCLCRYFLPLEFWALRITLERKATTLLIIESARSMTI